ncbi:MAG: 6-oxocyclohex-1-ene-1-carbonyl-CoA hydratase [Deltaproteobacteria bacterium]|nr:6-oxocyclohex-1-ene-1-carbonyl-CoA hydratase [Deltaproteobacteria bacterium]
MSLDWLPREDGKKDHHLWSEEHYGKEPPCTTFELRPIKDPSGKPVAGLHSAWITLNNPVQFNSYTTKMVKGVIAGFHRASADNSVVAAVFTGAGDKAFCTGGNTKEYAEYYSKRPNEYGLYMDLFNGMIDAILTCKKPTICRVNGMRIAGGQEIGTACDLALTADTAIFGQAGPRHGSAPDGGATDFLPWYMGIEDAMWSCVSCEMWSAYKMKRLGFVSKVAKVLKKDGQFIRNPLVVTDKWLEDGEIVYGEPLTGDAAKQAKASLAGTTTDFSLLDATVDDVLWRFTNLFPGCLIKSVESVRMKKKFFWDQAKVNNRHWLAANMMGEALLGFHAFNNRKLTGKDVIDFVEYRRRIDDGQLMNEALFEAVLPKPK